MDICLNLLNLIFFLFAVKTELENAKLVILELIKLQIYLGKFFVILPKLKCHLWFLNNNEVKSNQPVVKYWN